MIAASAAISAIGQLAGSGGAGPASVPDVYKPTFGGDLNFGDYYGGAATTAGKPPIAASVANNTWAIGAAAFVGLALAVAMVKRRR